MQKKSKNNEISNIKDNNEKELIKSKEEINLQKNIFEEEENLIGEHMDIIKSEANLLTEEGNLISKIKGITEENYSMEEYVPKIEEIIEMKLSYFKQLKQKINEYKKMVG